MGFAKIASGKNMLGIEDHVAWVTPGQFTVENVPCSEDGKMCGGVAQLPKGDEPVLGSRFVGMEYIDPSFEILARKADKQAVEAASLRASKR